jgi:hypothetical protein
MSGDEASLYNGCLIMAIIGGICYFYVMAYKAINIVKGLVMNIFGGGSSGGSKRVRCDGSDSELEAVKARDVFAGLNVKDSYEAENFGEQVGEIVDTSYEFIKDDGMGYGTVLISDGSVEASFARAQGIAKYSNFLAVFDEPQMRDFLIALHGKIRSKDLSEDEKWESINGAYCQLSVGKERRKAEVLRIYFRKLDTVFRRKDGTVYSKVISADEAQDIIEELIEVYPWDVPIKFETKVEPVKNAESEKRSSEIDDIKGSVSDIMNFIAQINDRLDKIK